MINLVSSPFEMKLEPLIVVPPEPQEFSSLGWGDFESVATPTFVLPMQCLETPKRALPTHFLKFALEESSCSTYSGDESDVSSLDNSAHETELLKKSSKGGRSVTFSSVELREYAVQLGDHPWCTEYPLALGWEHSEPMEYEVDEYELHYQRLGASFSAPRRLTPLQRRQRIAGVNETTVEQVDEEERQRRICKAKEDEMLILSRF